jgi:hypothetical protein
LGRSCEYATNKHGKTKNAKRVRRVYNERVEELSLPTPCKVPTIVYLRSSLEEEKNMNILLVIDILKKYKDYPTSALSPPSLGFCFDESIVIVDRIGCLFSLLFPAGSAAFRVSSSFLFSHPPTLDILACKST